MWMLSRQWQMGEFEGDDAGSPVLARACIDLRTIDRYQAADGAVHDLGADVALEARVEARPVPLWAGAQYLSLDLRLAAGRRWRKLLQNVRPPLARDYWDDYRDLYAVQVPNPGASADAAICAHADAWQQVGCAAERAMDGLALLEYLAESATNRAADGIAAPGDGAALDGLADRLRTWFAHLIAQPIADDDAWLPARLEYSFGLSAPSGELAADGSGASEIVMRADEYHHGNLDWWALERRDELRLGDPAVPAAVTLAREVQTFVPTQVVFDGMPNTRWWSFEDRRTNFGQIDPDTTDLGKLMLMEFALAFANDWFVVPWTLPTGCVAEVRGVAISTVFDERLWVTPVDDRPTGSDWERWTMFTLTEDAPGVTGRQAPVVPQLVMLPTAPKVQEGEAIEDVALVRDEMANMVWAIEHQIPLPTGWRRAGPEAAHEYRSHLRRIAGVGPVTPPPPAAPVRYRVMNEVPEQWIPFIAVHVDGSTRETQLQRAALPRFIEGHPNPQKIRPRTTLLRHDMPHQYLIHEEEVPRAGAAVSQCYQRTRLPDGSVVTWYGARKSTGRGEGSSGLAFDQLVDAPPA